MNQGKIPNQILKRSVIKNINSKREEIISGSGIGFDCAVLNMQGNCVYATSNPVICGIEYCENAVYRAVNNIASMGASPVAVLINIIYNRDFNECTLKNIMKRLDKTCTKLGIAIAGGTTSISAAVKAPVITVTGLGAGDGKYTGYSYRANPGEDIVITKEIAIEGANMMISAKKQELLGRYTGLFIEDAKYDELSMSVVEEALVAAKYGVTAMHDLSEGGVFSALWDISEACKVGFTVELKKIPVKQSTIELCEFFDINPYYTISGGSMVIITPDGDGLVDKLASQGIVATVVGKTTETKDKLIINGEEVRYLDTPQRDEIYKVCG